MFRFDACLLQGSKFFITFQDNHRIAILRTTNNGGGESCIFWWCEGSTTPKFAVEFCSFLITFVSDCHQSWMLKCYIFCCWHIDTCSWFQTKLPSNTKRIRPFDFVLLITNVSNSYLRNRIDIFFGQLWVNPVISQKKDHMRIWVRIWCA